MPRPILSMFKEGKEAEYFSSSDEFLDKVRFYLKNNDARDRIAIAGYQQVITAGHDIYSRMKQWLADVTNWWNSE